MDAKPDLPTPGSQPEANEPLKSDLIPEVGEPIPVKKPSALTSSAPDPVGNPIAGPSDVSQADEDRVLEEVNHKVKAANAEDNAKKGRFSWRRNKQAAGSPEAQKAASHSKKPVLIGAIAVCVAVGLSAVAYAAFSESSSPESPAIETAGNSQPANESSVTTDDLDKLANDMQAEADALNETEDFDSAALSDSSLGL